MVIQGTDGVTGQNAWGDQDLIGWDPEPADNYLQVLEARADDLERWQQIVSQVENLNAHGLAVLNETNERLQATMQDIRDAEATKTILEDRIKRLRAQVDRLDTAHEANRAVSCMKIFCMGLCGSDDEPEAEKARAMLFGLLVVGAIAYKTISSHLDL